MAHSSPHPRRVIAYHLIMTCYGFWLPNDPRGSGSATVWSEALREHGPATHVDSRHSVAKRPHDWRVRMAAKSSLKHPVVLLSGAQAREVARGFAHCLSRKHIACWACAIMPDHAHLVVQRGDYEAEPLLVDLKAAATHQLLEARLHPFQEFADRGEKLPKAFARSGRKIFLFEDADIERSVDYVNRNPSFDGLPPQRWSFVRSVAAEVGTAAALNAE